MKKHAKVYKTLKGCQLETTKGKIFNHGSHKIQNLDSGIKIKKRKTSNNEPTLKFMPANYAVSAGNRRNNALSNGSIPYFGSFKIKNYQE